MSWECPALRNACLLALATLVSSPVLADDALSACGFQLDEILQSLESLNDLEKLVPLVPPDEAAYLQKEEKASLSAQSAARFNMLIARPFYYPHKVHVAFADAKQKLESIASLPPDASPKWRIRVTAAAPVAVFNAQEAWDELVTADNGRLIDAKEVSTAAYRLRRAVYAPQGYISCLANLLEGL